MSKPKITSTIDYLSDPRKGITAAILLVLAVVVVWFLWKKIKGLWEDSSLSAAMDNKKIESHTGTSLTMLDSQYQQLAERIYDALAQSPIGFFGLNGTNEDEIYSVLGSLNTRADYLKLCAAWQSLYNSLSWWGRNVSQGGNAYSTLAATLKSELNSSELAHARAILTAKGITPDF